jgi:hypothetical protein
MTIDATPGGPMANAYVDVAEATLLLAERLDTAAWDSAVPADQETTLIWATRLLDEQVGWYGRPTTATQALAWPQTGQVDHLGRPVPLDIVPRVLKQATAFYAVALLEEEASGGTVGADAGIKTKKIGDTSITYKDEPAVQVSVTQQLPSDIRLMLRFYGMVPGLGIVPVYRT